MIKLIRPKKPEKLTHDEEALTAQFKKDESAVWRKSYIVEALANMSHSKCCYCETKLGEQAKNLQVEHYHCKSAYPDEVVKWENLLPACGQCNSNKGPHDTYAKPIIDPSIEDPRDYLYLKHYRITSKDNSVDSKGRFTINLLALNDRKRLVNPRIEIAEGIKNALEDFFERAVKLQNGEDIRQINKNKIRNGIRDILELAQPEAEYSAFMATIILNDDDYMEIKEILKKQGLWTLELQELENMAENIKLDLHS